MQGDLHRNWYELIVRNYKKYQLTPEEQEEYFEKYQQTGNKEYKNRLLLSLVPMLAEISLKYANSYQLDPNDLLHDAILYLEENLFRYYNRNHKHKAKISSYAYILAYKHLWRKVQREFRYRKTFIVTSDLPDISDETELDEQIDNKPKVIEVEVSDTMSEFYTS